MFSKVYKLDCQLTSVPTERRMGDLGTELLSRLKPDLTPRSKIQTAVVRLTLTHHELKPKPASITKCEQQLFTDTSGSAAGRTHLHSYKSTAVSLHREKGGGGGGSFWVEKE